MPHRAEIIGKDVFWIKGKRTAIWGKRPDNGHGRRENGNEKARLGFLQPAFQEQNRQKGRPKAHGENDAECALTQERGFKTCDKRWVQPTNLRASISCSSGVCHFLRSPTEPCLLQRLKSRRKGQDIAPSTIFHISFGFLFSIKKKTRPFA